MSVVGQPDITGRLNKLGENETAAKLGIFGGTFDPIHVGHLRVAEEIRKKLNLDGVLFVPAGAPVFKKNQEITSADIRLSQVYKATQSNPHFGVCDFEVKRKGDTFTIDTIRALRTCYAHQVQFFFIVGADTVLELSQWREIDELSGLVTFAIAGDRPEAPCRAQVEEGLAVMPGLSFEYVPVTPLDISSSEIRRLAQTNNSIRYLVPEIIRSEVMQQWCPAELDHSDVGDFAFKMASDLQDPYSDAFFEKISAELKARVGEHRFAHCEGVSQTAEELARCYGVDLRAARLAGLIHDWDKAYDDDAIRARAIDLGLEDIIDPQIIERLPATLHGMTAARALSCDYPQIPGEVLRAISLHTVASEHMEPLDMIVYVADAIEPSRQFGRIDELRGLVGTASLEELFFETYRYWTSLILDRKRPLYPGTISVWNAYASRLHHKKGRQ